MLLYRYNDSRYLTQVQRPTSLRQTTRETMPFFTSYASSESLLAPLEILDKSQNLLSQLRLALQLEKLGFYYPRLSFRCYDDIWSRRYHSVSCFKMHVRRYAKLRSHREINHAKRKDHILLRCFRERVSLPWIDITIPTTGTKRPVQAIVGIEIYRTQCAQGNPPGPTSNRRDCQRWKLPDNLRSVVPTMSILFGRLSPYSAIFYRHWQNSDLMGPYQAAHSLNRVSVARF